ncbi:peptidoglycan editing factor PgeF [Alteromonas stellipolaris]|uniref:peptidoglycan editing factor PgeF n=1 Tax=Alteromonas stellipolaris TaxID=233316 RepID=UPI0021182F45|nr:peptidoglycan editing factor PgeF [Alteromonas stellipolaris]MCQ8849538.1 peptidoglycan editing factor PgeF [Alteromonas stellipolaris]
MITAQWNSPNNVVAYTTTRDGSGCDQDNPGASRGEYAQCNFGDHVGDDKKAVALNRAGLPYANAITWLNQVHGNHVVTLPSSETEGDAAYTTSTTHFCAVMTADCVPILICDNAGKEVAAVHAGWKGLESEIISRTVNHFSSQASELMAWIGPAICQQCYEVDASLAQRFADYPSALCQGDAPTKFQLDLPAIAVQQLASLKVGTVINSQLCTYCNEKQFYSHRRATHQGKPSTGRMVSVIGLR